MKKTLKKLKLNKQTIQQINLQSMSAIRGGSGGHTVAFGLLINACTKTVNYPN